MSSWERGTFRANERRPPPVEHRRGPRLSSQEHIYSTTSSSRHQQTRGSCSSPAVLLPQHIVLIVTCITQKYVASCSSNVSASIKTWSQGHRALSKVQVHSIVSYYVSAPGIKSLPHPDARNQAEKLLAYHLRSQLKQQCESGSVDLASALLAVSLLPRHLTRHTDSGPLARIAAPRH